MKIHPCFITWIIYLTFIRPIIYLSRHHVFTKRAGDAMHLELGPSFVEEVHRYSERLTGEQNRVMNLIAQKIKEHESKTKNKNRRTVSSTHAL